jgi:hypothetical protein
MHEEEQYRYNMELLKDYFEQDLLEREEREALVRAYYELDAVEGPGGKFTHAESSGHNE